ncbi:hypothetical protein HDC94_002343 [Leifsonia sp. AK011]|uniref:P-loop ATPase, Sll1717 family n=1 Tax=Leifsonia sp. AK011 TaxID=2723075 RepID=UPI0015C9F7C9|nr:hypothetical protein [Leifsonia sp. AK011]NYF11187.1 hypothetical protein [Leifsonia sp. AK011]
MDELPASKLLNLLKLGSPVAEFDSALANYFVETDTFSQLVNDGGDTIAGDKGSGKTALFRILKDRFAEYEALDDVEVIAAFNPAGTPNFQRLIDAGVLDEGEYNGVWKTYVFTLAGNWLLDLYETARPGSLDQLEDLLQRTGLRVREGSPKSLFERLLAFFRPRTIEATTAFTPDGIPIFTSKMTFESPTPPLEEPDGFVPHDEALALLERCLEETGFSLWLVFDRLDEAFQAVPEVERPALRALFRAYLDMQDLTRVRLKLFVRRDLFARMIEGGFVNLTHINSRRISITWEDDDLYVLLHRRLIESEAFLAATDLTRESSPDDVFSFVFPAKVDPTSKRPTTWNWILTRIRDGNDVKSPRNLVDLIIKAVEAQKRREAQQPRVIGTGGPLITGDALKRALSELSEARVEDTLLAEAGETAEFIKRFENGKAEHNAESLANLLGKDAPELTKRLITLGFLEPVGKTYKVPPLYRQGLKITQGKAFQTLEGQPEDDANEDDE